jgi:hypothetical protein
MIGRIIPSDCVRTSRHGMTEGIVETTRIAGHVQSVVITVTVRTDNRVRRIGTGMGVSSGSLPVCRMRLRAVAIPTSALIKSRAMTDLTTTETRQLIHADQWHRQFGGCTMIRRVTPAGIMRILRSMTKSIVETAGISSHIQTIVVTVACGAGSHVVDTGCGMGISPGPNPVSGMRREMTVIGAIVRKISLVTNATVHETVQQTIFR